MSFFLAPFGLVWGVRYIRNKHRQVRFVGLMCIVLTIVALGITVYTFSSVMSSYTKLLNNLSIGRYSFE